MSDNIKIGFIGAGNHAAWTLYPTLQYFPQAKLVSVCDLNEDTAHAVGGRFGAERFYTDYTKMLDTEPLDALFCCSGPKLHAAIIAEAIERKLPLFVEKPPAPTSTELHELATKADAAGSQIMVAFMHRFASITTWAKKAVANEKFGRTMMIFAREGLWGMDCGGLVMDSGIHHIDLMRAFCGDVEWVQATRVTDGDRRHAMAITMMFANGVLGQLNLNSLESLTTPSDIIEIHGDQGGFVRLENWAKATWVRDPGVLFNVPNDPMDSSLTYEHGWTGAGSNRSTILQGYVAEMAHFFECLESGARPSPGLWDGYRAIQLVESINRSADTGERVAIK